ncbi:hypothetical protein CspeluHIS016_0402770 [Cutaneotrichosporon spelunceum]|uniref:Autophagy-related protein n=1 Tax=Cutaneotrichosporon spelunceum TaxID=1672016 RepID=A0AAD3YCS1_9TREE|nr:hypothetical protein CspeluHIS016_0402770 [Cutaneotrichosporon spelunceum]
MTGERLTTTRRERWGWYIYYVGNSGLGPFKFAMAAWLKLLHRAGWDPDLGPGSSCGGGQCHLHIFGAERNIHSIVLVTNAISFGFQGAVFLVLGSMADYGSWRPHIVTIATVIGWGACFGWLGVMSPPRWRAGTVLYIWGIMAYHVALTFWTAAFPALARDRPEMQQCEQMLASGMISKAEYEQRDIMTRNTLAHVSFALCSVGELVVLAVLCAIILAIAQGDAESNTRALSIVCAYAAGVWMFCSIPWIFNEQHRPGQQLPPGTTYLTAGVQQVYNVLRLWHRLKQTYLCLAAYFFLGECLNATGAPPNGFFILLVTVWGCVGFTQPIGFKSIWEFWLYQGFYGVFVSPFRAISQAMISEVVPRGKEFLFFSLFAIVSQTSVVGYAAARAIIDKSGNTNLAFTFLLVLGILAMMILSRVDVEQSHYECRKHLEDEAVQVYYLRHGEVREVAEKLAARDRRTIDSSMRGDTLPL